MSAPAQRDVRNRLLTLLPEAEFARLAEQLEPVDLPKRMVITEPEQPFEHVYFFNSGLGSLVATSREGQQAEAGLFGRDGFAPTAGAVGVDRCAYLTIIQVEGEGYRIGREALMNLLPDNRTLSTLLVRYLQFLSTQISYTALSNAVHQIDERLARWLLMCHDRVDGNDIALTHEFISLMLAVRRPSVTTALHVLEGNGFIRSDRGLVTIRNREGLEEFGRDAYGRPEAEYERLIGPLRH